MKSVILPALAIILLGACNNDTGKTGKPTTGDSLVTPTNNPPGYGDETVKDTSSYERMPGKLTDSMPK
ncbi:MAG TPA: hypothetical protein VK644_03555 [Chitinophagaceae bacterium]|nr:hypothetical protein [Chitinophagaceae bacterium]